MPIAVPNATKAQPGNSSYQMIQSSENPRTPNSYSFIPPRPNSSSYKIFGFAGQISDHDKHHTGLAVMVGRLGSEQSFEKFMRSHLNQLKTIYFDPMGIFDTSFKTANITLSNGYPAAKIEYSYVCAPDESSCDAFEVWTPHNNLIHEFRSHTTYHGGSNPFNPQFLRTAQKMINSLEITK